MIVFVDTSVWFAAAYAKDRGNARAKSILISMSELVTSNFVLLETWYLLRSRLSWSSAEAFFENIRSGIAAV